MIEIKPLGMYPINDTKSIILWHVEFRVKKDQT